MNDRIAQRIALLAGVAATLGLMGCSTVEVEMSGITSYTATAPGFGYGPGPGPSLVAGDQLAYRMVLAGAYDAPSAFDGTGYATVPVTDE